MKIFANVGLNTAEVEYHVFGNQPALVVKRYDRKQINGVWERVHQEDMCQAAGVTPSDKYESEQIGASMNLEKIISIINTYSGQTIQYNIDQLFRWCICSYLIGNTDNHAKNCAIILSGNEAKLAPFYDVASVYGFNKEAKYNTFGIYFAGCKQLNQMTKQNLLSLCDLFNKNSKGIDSEINQLYNDLLNSIVLTRGEYMHINGVNEICDEIIVKVQKCFKTLK
jgi:serine/threonine-protein kinase HipA